MSNGHSEPKPGEIVIANSCDDCTEDTKDKLDGLKGPVTIEVTKDGHLLVKTREKTNTTTKAELHFRRKPPKKH